MSVRYIFNTSGKYVAFIFDENLFSPECFWLGIIVNGNTVYNTNGLYIGYVSEDDRIIRNRMAPSPRPILKPGKPFMPLRPLTPLRRLRMNRLPAPYEDVFEAPYDFSKLALNYQNRSFHQLLGTSIFAQDGQFLGVISRDRYDANSISNNYGNYGSPYSPTSIFNDYGAYGGEYSHLSPFNKYTSSPPQIVDASGTPMNYLTVNIAIANRIDTNELMAWLNAD